jgi:pimeloyl-ACP methyl ester carboxylesterase
MTLRAAAVVLAALAAGCGGSSEPRAAVELHDPAPCSDVPDATCSRLRVPLDRLGETEGTLSLRVAVAGPPDGPVMVMLSGGPGQPGLPLIERARAWFGEEAVRLRLVAIDQRGTGDGALECPALQRAMGASDLTPPPAAAVRDCARAIGDKRRYFTTADTVADLERLRRALNVRKIALNGTSYGSYVAQRYALEYPHHVSRLVLDSVVPAAGLSLLPTVQIQAAERVLGSGVAADLAHVVEAEGNGPEMLDMLTGLSVGAPRDNGAAEALDAAAEGNTGPLEGLHAGVLRAMRWPAERLSQGLHAATLCADMPAPWGDASADMAGRREALEREAAKLEDLYPFDRETATGNGFVQQCLHWPPVPVREPAGPRDLPPVPVLLLAGDLDLSTPLEWARQAAARAPRGELVIAKDTGHGVQRQGNPEALAAVRRFVASLRG